MATGGQCGSSNRGQTAVFYWAGTYDAVGDLIGETDADGHIVTHQYDARHRRVKSTDAVGTRFAATFDGAGNQVSETDANGTLTEYRYDAGNRLLSATRAGGPGTQEERRGDRRTVRTRDGAAGRLTITKTWSGKTS